MAGIHFEATLNNSNFISGINEIQRQVERTAAIVERMSKPIDEGFGKSAGDAIRKMAKELGDVKIDLSNPQKELKAFDNAVISMCQSLERYFGGVEEKLQACLSIAKNSQLAIGGMSATGDNVAKLEEAKKQNDELIAKIQQQNKELEEQKEIYRQLADAVKTNNVSAIQSLSQTSSRSNREIRKDIKAANDELKQQEKIVEELQAAYRDAQAKETLMRTALSNRNGSDRVAISDKTRPIGYRMVGDDDLAKAHAATEKMKNQLEEARDEQERLNGVVTQYEQELDDASKKHVRIRTQIMEAREQMAQMIATGKTGTPMFYKMANEAAKMREEMNLANATLQYFADPNRHLTTLKTGLQGVAGSFGLVNGVVGLFNDKSERMAEIQTKIQSVMAIVVGLETTYNLVKKSSNVMLAIEEVRTWALAKARGTQTVATVAATGAQEALNTAMRTNPIGAIISLLAILGTAIYGIIKVMSSETDEEKKAREEKEKHAKAIRKLHDDWAKSVAQSASKQILSYKKLQLQWNTLGNDLNAKKKFINDNQDAFHDLGGAINSVSDAEKFFVEHTDAVVASMMARAKAAAYEELAAEEIKKLIENENKKSLSNGKVRRNFHAGYKMSETEKKIYAQGYGIDIRDIETKGGKLTNKGADKLNSASLKAAIGRQKETSRKNKETEKTVEGYLKKSQEASLEAQKEWEKIGVNPYAKDNNTGGDNTKEILKSYQELSDELLKMQKERIDAELEAEKEYTEKWEQLQRDKILIQQELDVRAANQSKDKEIEEIDKSEQGKAISNEKAEEMRAQIAEDTKKRIDAINAKAVADEKKLTEDRIKREKEAADKELQSRIDYLKAYGNAAQKKIAIEEEAAAKIKKIQESTDTEESKKYQIQGVQKQAEQDKRGIDQANLKNEIDWAALFQGTSMMKDIAEATIAKVEAYMENPDFKNSSATDQQTIINALNNLRAQTGEKNGLIATGNEWKTAIQDMKKFGESVRNLTDKQKDLKAAMDMAQSNYDMAKTAGDTEAMETFEKQLTEATQAYEDNEKAIQASTDGYVNAQQRATQASETFASKVDGFVSGMKELGSANGLSDLNKGLGSIMGAFGATDEAGNKVSSATDALGKAGGYIGAAFSLADMINSQGLDSIISNIADTLAGAISGIMESMFSADFYVGIFKSIGNVFAAPFAAIFGNDNMKELQKKIDGLKASNEVLAKVNERLVEKVDESSTVDAANNLSEVKKTSTEMEKNSQNMRKYIASQHDWNSRSLNKIFVENMDMGRLNKGLDGNYGDLANALQNATDEQWAKFAENDAAYYELILQRLRDWGNGEDRGSGEDLASDIEAGVQRAKQLEELTDSVRAKFAGITFDQMFDNWKSTLKDMSSTAEDFTDGIQNSFNDAMLNIVGDTFEKDLKHIYDGMAEALKKGDYSLLDKYKKQYEEISQEALKAREDLKKQGYIQETPDRQEAEKKGFATASQESVDELNGRFTAVQISAESIEGQMIAAVMYLETMSGAVVSTNGHVAEIRNMMIYTNSYLEEMAKYAKLTYKDFSEKIDAIVTNTRYQ